MNNRMLNARSASIEHSIVMNYTAKENQAQSGFLSPFLRPAKTKTGCSLSDIVSCQRLQPVFSF